MSVAMVCNVYKGSLSALNVCYTDDLLLSHTLNNLKEAGTAVKLQ